jgi:hypothetical protein
MKPNEMGDLDDLWKEYWNDREKSIVTKVTAKYGKQCAVDMIKWAKEKDTLIDNGTGNKGWVKKTEEKYGIDPHSL